MLAVLALLTGTAAAAEEFSFRSARTHLVDQIYLLDASLNYRFSARTLTALENGVPLTVRLDIRIDRERDYWLDAKVAHLEQRYQLQYHTLTGLHVVRNLNSGASEVFVTREGAIASLGRVRDLPVLDHNLLRSDTKYSIAVRAQLDLDALPALLRPLAYVTPAWWHGSTWQRWSLVP